MRKSKKRKSLFVATEAFFKKYQTIFSILIPSILSAVAIWVSLNANELAKNQIEKEKIPIWDYQLIYDESNSSLLEVRFSSLKSNFRIQTIEVFTPQIEGISKIAPQNNVWRIGIFEDQLLNAFFNIYEIPQEDEFSQFSKCDCNHDFPIIIKFSYQHENNVEQIFGLYKINFDVYSEKKLKIKALSLVQFLEPSWADNLQKKLTYLYNTEYFGKLNFAFTSEVDTIINKNKTLFRFSKLLDSASERYENTYISYFKKDIRFPDEVYSIYVPLVYKDSARFSNFITEMDSLSYLLKTYPQNIQNDLTRIDSFVKKNPPVFDISSARNTNWLSEKFFNNWHVFIIDIKINLWKYAMLNNNENSTGNSESN
jgi:hypothetical protein